MLALEIIPLVAKSIGIVGVILLLIAYYLLNINKLSAFSLTYQVLNLLGALFILISLFYEWNTAAVLIESAWILISLVGIRRALKLKSVASASRGRGI
ncbi:MAG TPA: hypothetical protein VHZ76_00495 [Gammaproteobacteria bacterium]|jgi:hypothetical protein|nr:hypothetical protein [Gammaproteobacteria bacterium]